MRRVDKPELLDSGSGTSEEIQHSLLDLRRINRFLGGTRTSRILMKRVAEHSQRKELTVLDVAAGSGDVMSEVSRQLGRQGIQLLPTFLDHSAEHLSNTPGGRRIAGDALSLPFAGDSFDVVTCSLFMHHLTPVQVAVFSREALRVARIAFVINDLIRSPLHLALTCLAFPAFSRLTRHDSVASVRRAYTPAETKEMLQRSGAPIACIESSKHYLFRLGVIAWKLPVNSI